LGAVDPAGVKLSARAAAARLRIDSATAEALRAFDAVGVQSILLKGASNRDWLGDTDAKDRWYADCDLLIRPGDQDPGAEVLTELGFVADYDARQMPAWWHEPALSWTRKADGAVIDLHRTLPGVGVDDRRAWAVLAEGSEEIVVGGYPARALSIPGRAMHLAIHGAQHGPRWAMGLGDLSRALERVDEETWQAAAQLARQLDATAMFVAGLRLLSAGRTVVERLGLASVPGADAALLRDDPSALTLERFLRADPPTRVSMIRHKLFPPVTFMRHWSPLARRGNAGLLLAYTWRPIWMLAQLPATVRAWRRRRHPDAADDA
jgi:Uncharacterised nucleotidyltransferase